MAQQYKLNTESFATQSFPEEVIVLDVHKGTYYALTGNAPQAWLALLAGLTIPGISAQIAKRTGSEQHSVETELSRFVAELVEDTVLLPREAEDVPAAQAADGLSTITEYLGFVCDKHSDLDELLVLDPIHDVNPQKGWPHGR